MASAAGSHDDEYMIMLSGDRMAFGGPQVPSNLLLGGYVIYSCVDGPFELTIEGVCTTRRFAAIVPPYTKHSVVGPASLRSILVEAETVAPEIVDDERFNGESARDLAQRIDTGFIRWKEGKFNSQRDSFDLFFFGERLQRRQLDARVVHVLNCISNTKDGSPSEIGAMASDVALSPSRLRHLFCEQVGVSIRSYRAWKRLRNAICLALEESNLLQLAMAAGYADSTHLCHSVKLYFGEQPTFVWTHWRNANFLQIDTSEFAALGTPANDMLASPFPDWESGPAPSLTDSRGI